MIIAIALGVGLGTGLRKSQGEAGGTSSSSGSTGSSNSTSPSNATSHALTLGALNNTSLAAVTTPDGNRHIFLQDINGTLRHAVYSSAANFWLPDADFLLPPVPVSPPRLGTPITATCHTNVSGYGLILVYYVNVNETISAIHYETDLGAMGGDVFNGSTVVKPDSHCVSALTVEYDVYEHYSYALLFFEAPSGNISFLYGQTTSDLVWEWQNMSGMLASNLRQDHPPDVKASLGCPWISFSQRTNNSLNLNAVEAAFFNPGILMNASEPVATGIAFTNATDIGVVT